MEYITLEGLKRQGHLPLSFHQDSFLPFTSLPLTTPSGKIEFYSEALAAQGRDGLPSFVAPVESRLGRNAERFPLEFLGRKADNYMNSTFANLEGHRKMEARTSQRLEMHPTDAKARGIEDGDSVRVWNDRGEIALTAMVDGTVPEGVVAARLDWSRFNEDRVNVNTLTSERLTDIGGGATFYSALVEVSKR
jgi:anaerobic selenocysteine-containing dehydrogenase